MIRVESLSKSYGPNRAIDRLTFSVARGEVLGFLGPNGAGKTTTMRILTGFMPPGEGTVLIDGLDAGRESLAIRRRIGYLPESVPIYRESSVTDYLGLVADVKGVPRRGRQDAMSRVLEQCGLTGVRQRIVGRLSRGYRQRVGLAQALINDPPVLILDEPTVGLDPAQVVEVRDLIRGLAGSRTIILSTHILPEVSQIASRILI
ncbi:MAG: ATP-binding cassette domain-containing protein, partial [Candidatus Eisenbacteria bacterium]|nr:ATP-binding cassette domain-containing protein [Candidatus Eisenbacteria bacterium]